MDEQKKLQRMLEIILYLSVGIKRTIEEISERFEIAPRTAERYIATYREAGFVIPRPVDGLYYIDKNSPYFKEIDELLHFSKEEAYILQKAIHSISEENLLKSNLVKKLYSLYDFDRVPDTIVKQEHSEVIHQLQRAIKQKRKVILKGYLSANSGDLRNREVEPYNFTTNYLATWAFDTEDNCCKTFKNTRIKEVEILTLPWENEKLHKTLPMDVFRISTPEQIKVKLKLSIRAYELLCEEYPLAETCVTRLSDNEYFFESFVCSFDGVGRFILGLPGEVEVLEPEHLKIFLRKKAIFFM